MTTMKILIGTAVAGAMAALTMTVPAFAQVQYIGNCSAGGLKLDTVCAQRTILEKGYLDRNGRACYLLGSPVTRDVIAKWEIERALHSFNGRDCQEGRTTYDEALRQCAAQGVYSCRQLASGSGRQPAAGLGGILVPNGAANAGSLVGTARGGTPTPQPQQGGTSSIGGVLDTIEDAASTINTLKGLFQ